MTPTPTLATWPGRADQNGGFTTPFGVDDAARADRGDFAIVHGVDRLVGVVFGVAVAEMRGYQQVALRFHGQDRHGRK